MFDSLRRDIKSTNITLGHETTSNKVKQSSYILITLRSTFPRLHVLRQHISRVTFRLDRSTSEVLVSSKFNKRLEDSRYESYCTLARIKRSNVRESILNNREGTVSRMLMSRHHSIKSSTHRPEHVIAIGKRKLNVTTITERHGDNKVSLLNVSRNLIVLVKTIFIVTHDGTTDEAMHQRSTSTHSHEPTHSLEVLQRSRSRTPEVVGDTSKALNRSRAERKERIEYVSPGTTLGEVNSTVKGNVSRLLLSHLDFLLDSYRAPALSLSTLMDVLFKGTLNITVHRESYYIFSSVRENIQILHSFIVLLLNTTLSDISTKSFRSVLHIIDRDRLSMTTILTPVHYVLNNLRVILTGIKRFFTFIRHSKIKENLPDITSKSFFDYTLLNSTILLHQTTHLIFFNDRAKVEIRSS